MLARSPDRSLGLPDEKVVQAPLHPAESFLLAAFPHCFETGTHPVCSHCGSANTADVGCGIIGRTINIAAATTKFKLIVDGPAPGKSFCNTCNEFFN